MSDIIELNVGGVAYTTSRSTLTRYPDSMLARMFTGDLPSAKDKDGRYFIDRDGECFRYILNFLRTSQVPCIDNKQLLSELCIEADFYQISALLEGLENSKPEPIPIQYIELREIGYVTRMFGPVALLKDLHQGIDYMQPEYKRGDLNATLGLNMFEIQKDYSNAKNILRDRLRKMGCRMEHYMKTVLPGAHPGKYSIEITELWALGN